MVDRREVSLLRIAAQRVAGPRPDSPTEVVGWLGAVQAQDLGSAVAAAALRTEAGTRATVEAALDAGEVVRSWPMRGTLHLVAAADLAWMLTLGPPRVATTFARRQQQLGLDDAIVDAARRVAVDGLGGGRRLRRAELMQRWEDAGLATTGGRGYHLLVHLAQAGVVCLGPTVAGEQAVVLVEEWVRRPRRLDRDEAMAEWVRRYFTGHGPATLPDFCWWTKQTLTAARVGLAAAASSLESIEVDGVQHWMDPATPDRLSGCRTEAAGVHLLPGFDELLLGYADRTALVDPAHADTIVPGGNGIFQPIVVEDGCAVGTWRPAGARRAAVEATPFDTFSPAVEAALAAATARPR